MPNGAWNEITMFERDAVKALASSASSTVFSWAACSAVYCTPATAKTLWHILRYSSIMLGTAGTVICVATTDRRYNRRATASLRADGLKDLTAGSSIRPLYTTRPCSTSGGAGALTARSFNRGAITHVCQTPGI